MTETSKLDSIRYSGKTTKISKFSW